MTEENITVSVRVRPMSTKELDKGHVNSWIVSQNNIQSADRSYNFDKVFHSGQSTEAVFEALGEKVVWGVMDGFNGCMFCYGQTGSGKTYTMYGVRPNFPGIVPMTIETIFAFIHETVDKEFLVRCSYLEIYNECVNDLLDSNKSNLSLRENKQGGLKILELTEKECVSINQVYSLLALGDANRQVASTNFNLKSSRSHSIFRLVAESKSRSENRTLSKGVLYLIDLAGSEGASAHSLGSSERTQEMKFINRSLLTLGTVIMRLSEKSNPIPYRDSKLTRVLRPALEGNTRISVICNISPSNEAFEESISTLEFAKRAKRVKQNIKKVEPDASKMVILKYEREIVHLQTKLREMEEKVRTSEVPDLFQEIGAIKEQLSQELNQKSKLSEAFENAIIEKTKLEAEIAKLKSCILVSENIPMKPVEAPGASLPSERRVNRLTFCRDTEDLGERVRTESILASSPEEFFRKVAESPESARNLHKTIVEINSPSIDLSTSLNMRDTMLLDKIENFNDLFEGFGSRQSVAFNLSAVRQSFAAFNNESKDDSNPSKDQLIQMLAEQDRIIESLQKELSGKNEEIDVLKDELGLCRNNMKVLQQKLRESRK